MNSTKKSSSNIDLANLTSFASIARKVAEGLDEKAVAQAIVDEARQVLQADRTAIILPVDNKDFGRVAAQSGFQSAQAGSVLTEIVPLKRLSIIESVFRDAEPVVINDTHLHEAASRSVLVESYDVRAFCVMPLCHEGKVIGVLAALYSGAPHEWTNVETEWLRALADLGAEALVVGAKLAAQRHSLVIRDALHTAGQRLQSASNIDTVITATLEGVARVVPCVGASIHLLSEDGKTATVAGLWGYGEPGWDDLRGLTYSVEDSSLNSRTFIDHEAFFLDDFQTEAEKWSNTECPTLRAWMSVPLLSNDRCLGKITVDHEMPGAYNAEKLAIVQTFAAHAAVAIERARLYAKATDRANQLALLAKSARTLVSNLDLTAVLQSVVDNASVLTEGEACLRLYDETNNQLSKLAYSWSEPWYEGAEETEDLPASYGLSGAALSEQVAIVTQDLLEEPRTLYKGKLQVRSAVMLPLSVGTERLGVLEIAWREPNAVTQERFALCMAFADHASLAIHNAHHHSELLKREGQRTMLLNQLLTAQEDERKLVALELHDGPLQSLSVGLINADTLRKKAQAGTDITPDDIEGLRRYFADVVGEIRGLMADLRPEVLDSYGLLAGLEAYIRRFKENTVLEISILYDLRERLPDYLEVLTYRLVQEALNNVRKHAQATHASIKIHVDKLSSTLTVQIRDNGVGFDPHSRTKIGEGFGLGFKSMNERVRSASGTMHVDSAPKKGTTVAFYIPLAI
ncbi:MAG TPA: GAF domain-containing sensor histidine kinase [Chloroflexia bacterium]|nr:GAF domain-containing sensor histidine kinase [Chloroflexia bacterium]